MGHCVVARRITTIAMPEERTFIIIKRFEQKGFKLVGMKILKADEDLLKQHYDDLISSDAVHSSDVYPQVSKYMTSGALLAMCWEGTNVVQTARHMIGSHDPSQPLSDNPKLGSIRADFCRLTGDRNIIHGSKTV